jgi:hypothetical protein
MPRAGFDPSIPANKLPQTYALDSAATGIGSVITYRDLISLKDKRRIVSWPLRRPFIIRKYDTTVFNFLTDCQLTRKLRGTAVLSELKGWDVSHSYTPRHCHLNETGSTRAPY